MTPKLIVLIVLAVVAYSNMMLLTYGWLRAAGGPMEKREGPAVIFLVGVWPVFLPYLVGLFIGAMYNAVSIYIKQGVRALHDDDTRRQREPFP